MQCKVTDKNSQTYFISMSNINFESNSSNKLWELIKKN